MFNNNNKSNKPKSECGFILAFIDGIGGGGGEENEAAVVTLTEYDFLLGVLDLSGEMMRFATTTAALNGELAGAPRSGRTIVADMQQLGSFFAMLPQPNHHGDKTWQVKMDTLRASVHKVENLGYGLRIRGSERPKGWMPDAGEGE